MNCECTAGAGQLVEFEGAVALVGNDHILKDGCPYFDVAKVDDGGAHGDPARVGTD